MEALAEFRDGWLGLRSALLFLTCVLLVPVLAGLLMQIADDRDAR